MTTLNNAQEKLADAYFGRLSNTGGGGGAIKPSFICFGKPVYTLLGVEAILHQPTSSAVEFEGLR